MLVYDRKEVTAAYLAAVGRGYAAAERSVGVSVIGRGSYRREDEDHEGDTEGREGAGLVAGARVG